MIKRELDNAKKFIKYMKEASRLDIQFMKHCQIVHSVDKNDVIDQKEWEKKIFDEFIKAGNLCQPSWLSDNSDIHVMQKLSSVCDGFDFQTVKTISIHKKVTGANYIIKAKCVDDKFFYFNIIRENELGIPSDKKKRGYEFLINPNSFRKIARA